MDLTGVVTIDPLFELESTVLLEPAPKVAVDSPEPDALLVILAIVRLFSATSSYGSDNPFKRGTPVQIKDRMSRDSMYLLWQIITAQVVGLVKANSRSVVEHLESS